MKTKFRFWRHFPQTPILYLDLYSNKQKRGKDQDQNLNSLSTIHNLFLIQQTIELNMFESGISELVSYLVLITVTLLFVSVVFLFYSLFKKSSEVDRLKQVLQGTIKKLTLPKHTCQYEFGYLNSLPKSKPIPPECMGCSDILECLTYKEKKEK
jgi:hypothetical protein